MGAARWFSTLRAGASCGAGSACCAKTLPIGIASNAIPVASLPIAISSILSLAVRPICRLAAERSQCVIFDS
tara:strand:+ start:928 stop:1143 length:216 start_codon:yes stop_codon:yes gene_type:complete